LAVLDKIFFNHYSAIKYGHRFVKYNQILTTITTDLTFIFYHLQTKVGLYYTLILKITIQVAVIG